MVGIVFIGDLYVCPYLHRYTEACEAMGVSYDVLFWNRCGEKMNVPNNYIYFDMPSEEEQPYFTKVIDFIKFRKWLLAKLKHKQYKKLIILSTLSGIILSHYLRRYKGKYVFDIRDHSYEGIKLFYCLEERIISNSAYTAISSPGFRNFLPHHYYYLIHNMQSNEATHSFSFRKKREGYCLNVVWNGTMRYFKHQKNVIDRLANDERFLMIFHGTGTEFDQYRQYAIDSGIKNIVFTGRYSNADKAKLLENADILNNSYWTSNTKEVLYALSNRYYDGLIYKIPQLVETKTYKTSLCEGSGIGIGIDARSSTFADELYRWYISIDETQFEQSCNALLQDALADDMKVRERLDWFLSLEE